jgi:hypothetical protein
MILLHAKTPKKMVTAYDLVMMTKKSADEFSKSWDKWLSEK